MNGLAIETAGGADAIAAADWQRLCPAGDPFLNADFFSIVERHGAAGSDWGWVPRHLVARDRNGHALGILPLYLKFNSYGDFIHDWTWSSAYRQLGRAYYPRLLTGLPHTPATGRRLLVDRSHPDADEIAMRLVITARELADDAGLSSWHVAFPDADEHGALLANGLISSHDIQFHWSDRGFGDFAGFLSSLTADKRRKVRAERRRALAAGLDIEVRHGDEIAAAEWPVLHGLYAATFDRFANHAVFTADCFADLAAALGRRMVVFIARSGQEAVAASICFRSNEALYGRYWGCRRHYDSLHFELCFYQGIAYCLQQGLRRFEPGAGGEHKIARGFSPTLVKGFHWIADPKMRTLIAQHLERQDAAVIRYRDESASHLPYRSRAGDNDRKA